MKKPKMIIVMPNLPFNILDKEVERLRLELNEYEIVFITNGGINSDVQIHILP